MTDVERAIACILRGSYTEEGVRAWFDRPRHRLNDQTPRMALKLGWIEEVTNLALDLLEMGAT